MIKRFDKLSGNYYYKGRRTNHVSYLLMPTKEYTTSVNIHIAFGAKMIRFKERMLNPGSAHFLEHKIFAQKDQTDGFMALSNLGVLPNAYTTYEETVYTFQTVEMAYDALITYLKILNEPYFTKKNIAQEVSIITSEIQMYDDQIEDKISDQLVYNLYGSSGFKYPILGDERSIRNIKKEELMWIQQSFYGGKHMQIEVSGPIDVDRIVKIIDQYAKDTSDSPRYMKHRGTLKPAISYQEIKAPFEGFEYIAFGLRFRFKGYKAFQKRVLIACVERLLFAKSSKFYEYLFQSGHIKNDYFAYIMPTDDDFLLHIQFKTLDAKKAHEAIISSLKSYDESQLESIKKAQIGNLYRYLERSDSTLELISFCQKYHTTLEDYLAFLSTITLEDILSVVSTWKEENSGVIVYI